jgi:isocitrate dehydrogenase kinase/phosphatase
MVDMEIPSAYIRIAPGIRGMVMLMFYLPSFPCDRHKRCQARPIQKSKRKSDV